jgi:hypothetical protein
MPWERARRLVNAQISNYRSTGEHEWAEALELCLARAERHRSLQEVIVDLRQRLEAARRLTEDQP